MHRAQRIDAVFDGATGRAAGQRVAAEPRLAAEVATLAGLHGHSLAARAVAAVVALLARLRLHQRRLTPDRARGGLRAASVIVARDEGNEHRGITMNLI